MLLGSLHITGAPRRRTIRSILMAGAACTVPALAITGAAAQEVEVGDERTTPIATATADNGNPADITITEDGSIELDSGTAITINSNNSVEQDGDISLGQTDDAIGVLIEPGNTGGYVLNGLIDMRPTDEQIAQNAEEIVTDYADNRRGVLLNAGGTFTGDILLDGGSVLQIAGDDSVAVDLAGSLDGNLQLDGNIVAYGENIVSLAIRETVTGDVVTGASSNISTFGDGAIGMLVDGTIDGALVHGGTISSTGYLDNSRDPDDAENNNNEEQAALQNVATVDIRGTVTGGVLVNGPIPAIEQDDDYTAPAQASIQSNGSGPAVWLRDGAVLGAVDTGLSDAYGTYGFINRGGIVSQGIYSGVDATGIRVGAADIAGGLRNDGSIQASTVDADAIGIELTDGASLGTLFNYNAIEVAAADPGAVGVNSVAVHIGEGASLPVLNNDFRISAATQSDTGNAYGIRDESGTLSEIINNGAIQARIVDFPDEDNVLPGGEAVAIDVSANSGGVTIRNSVNDEYDADTDNRRDFGVVTGDVLFGTGDDAYYADAGPTNGDIYFGAGSDIAEFSMGASLNGDAYFGAGADRLSIDGALMASDLFFGGGADTFEILNDSFFRGEIADGDGQLDITVSGGSSLYKTGTGVTDISSLFIGSASTLGIGIGENGDSVSAFNVSGSATLEDGATIQPVFLGGSVEQVSANIVTAGMLNVSADNLTIGDDEGNVPYLFNIQLLTGTDEATGNDTLVLDISRRTAEELGIQEGLAPAYVPTLEALATDENLGPLVLNFTDGEDFTDALNQLLAGPLDAPLAYARAQNNSVTSIITQRLDLARNAGDYPRTFWLQEETYFLNRDSDEISNGFDGGGFSLAAGVDAGLDNFVDAVGLSVSMSSAKYDEKRGGDYPFERLTYGFGGYAAMSLGAMQFDTRAEYAITKSESERNISIAGIDRTAFGEWDGTQLAASARVRYAAEVASFTAEPFVSLDYLSVDEDAYEETGGGNGVNLAASDRSFESLRGNVGLRLGKVFELTPSSYDTGIPGTLHPQLTLAWSQEMITDPLEAEYRYLSGGDEFTLFAEPEDGSAIVGADVAYENEYAKVHLGLSGSMGDTTDAVILRAGVGLKW